MLGAILLLLSFAEPPTVNAPLLFKDEGCAVDYLKATALSGVAKRKAMADLIVYGCVERRARLYQVAVMERKGKLSKVALFAIDAPEDPDELFASGWMLSVDIKRP